MFGSLVGMPALNDTFRKARIVNGFDSAAGNAVEQLAEKVSPVSERAALAAMQGLRSNALSIVLLLVDAVTDNTIDDDTLPSEYLDILMIAAIDSDDDAEIDPLLSQVLWANIADVLATFEVDEDVVADILSEDVEAADAAIEAMAETVLANLPDSGEPLDEFAEQFVYGFEAKDMFEDEVEDQFDAMKKPRVGANSVRTDASGRKIRSKGVKVVRNGKVTVVNKRLPNQHVMKSAKQKAALNKLHSKPHTAAMSKKALRSMNKGKTANLY